MPEYRTHNVVRISKRLRAFLNFEVGLVRGEAPKQRRRPGAPRRKQGPAEAPAPAEDSYETLYDRRIQKQGPDRAVGAARDFGLVGALELEILRGAGLKPTDTLVDLGCGAGRLAVHVIPYLAGGRYVGIDVARAMLDSAKERVAQEVRDPPCEVSWRHQTTPSFQLADGSVDVLCAFSVINHIEHEDAYSYFADARRIVRPGGLFVFSCLPIDTELGREAFLKMATMDLKTRRKRVPHVATSVDLIEDVARLAGWEPLRWFNGDEENVPLDGKPYSFGQSTCVLERPSSERW